MGVAIGSDELWCHLASSFLSRGRPCNHHCQELVRHYIY